MIGVGRGCECSAGVFGTVSRYKELTNQVGGEVRIRAPLFSVYGIALWDCIVGLHLCI